MAPTEGGCDRPQLAPRVIERVEAAIGVGLRDAVEPSRCRDGCSPPAIARGVVEGGWRCGSTERLVVPEIGPDPVSDRLDESYARTMAFATLVIFQLFNVFNCRSSWRSSFSGLF
jgi:hypothetical protein